MPSRTRSLPRHSDLRCPTLPSRSAEGVLTAKQYHIYIYIYIYVHMCMYTYIYVFFIMYTVYTYTYIYIYMYYVYIYIYIYVFVIYNTYIHSILCAGAPGALTAFALLRDRPNCFRTIRSNVDRQLLRGNPKQCSHAIQDRPIVSGPMQLLTWEP